MAKRGRPAKEVIETPIEQKDSNPRKLGRLIEPGLLLLLKENPTHGYDLLKKLNDLEIIEDSIDPGTVYRTLRNIEKDGLIKSRWDTEGPGPARRIYEVTSAANAEIEIWVKEIEKEIGLFEALLKQLKSVTA